MAYQNFFATKLFTDIGASDTTITLETAPTATSGRLVLEARNATQKEIIKYTGVAGNTITGVTRGQGGTTAKSHIKNALVEMNATAEDFQDMLDAFASFAASATEWRTSVAAWISTTNNGNRSYDVVLSGDQRAIWSPGMRFRSTRTVLAPTQSTSLNGTTQYYSKATPAGITFTDDFMVSAWVKLSSYQNGQIVGRYDGTNGWLLYIDSSGRVVLQGNNTGSVNSSSVISYQSIPLNKWVHVSAQLDMSAFTATPTTSYIMLDGVDVPATAQRFGTFPTALVQGASALTVGSQSGGAGLFLSGKVAQVAVFSAKVTQATMRGYISQGLAGTETTLISAYSFNNTLNDLNTTNANNLTANNGAVATNADSPFGTQADGRISSTLDYGIIQAVNFSTNTTLTVLVADGCTIPTSGGVASISYSGAKSPYGFPGVSPLYAIESSESFSTANQTTTPVPGLKITVPYVPIGKNVRVKVDFSQPTINAVTNIIWSITENSVLKTGRIITVGGINYLSTIAGEITFPSAGGTNVVYQANFWVGANTGSINGINYKHSFSVEILDL